MNVSTFRRARPLARVALCGTVNAAALGALMAGAASPAGALPSDVDGDDPNLADNAVGDNSVSSLRVESPTSTPPPTGTGTGLNGEYFAEMDLTNLKLTRTDAAVDFNWADGSQDPAMTADRFSVRLGGQVQRAYSETSAFSSTSDDAARLWENDQLVIDRWVGPGATETSGTITLSAGVKYSIRYRYRFRYRYYDNGSDAVAQLRWASPSEAKQIVPHSQRYPVATGPSAGRGTGLNGECIRPSETILGPSSSRPLNVGQGISPNQREIP